jgi:hypothetical protein
VPLALRPRRVLIKAAVEDYKKKHSSIA